MRVFTYIFMTFFASRVLAFFFAAWFLGMQLSQVDDFEPLQHTESFYAVESSGVDWSSAAISTFVYPQKHPKIKPKLATQNAPLSLQRQHLVLIEQQAQQTFVHRMQQRPVERLTERLVDRLVRVKQAVCFAVQQQSRLFIQYIPSNTYRLYQPEPDEYPSHFSLS